MTFQKSLRLQKIPPYVFAKIDEKKAQLTAEGKDLIDLGVGDPDLPTPKPIIESLFKASEKTENHRYPPYGGIPDFRKAAADWMQQRFSVTLDPKTEILGLIGSKEGIFHLCMSVLNPGDFCLLPDPGYPAYVSSIILAGGTPVMYPLSRQNNFKPDWSEISEQTWQAVKMIFINYPQNPTGATVDLDCYVELVKKAKKYGFIICSDGAYCEQGYSTLPPCCLQVPGAKDVTIEMFSMSKTYNMTGWRIGFAAGGKELIAALNQLKQNADSGVFKPIQHAAITAMKGPERELVEPSREIFQFRRKIIVDGLRHKGYDVFDGGATFYIWVGNPKGFTSAEVAAKLLDVGVVVTPGSGFGERGEGFFRIAVTVGEDRLKQALERIPAFNAWK